MDDVDTLRFIERQLYDSLDVEGLSLEEAEAKVRETFKLLYDEFKESSIQTYRELAPRALADIRDENAQFEKRNLARWKPAFDHLEMMWHVASEIGELHGKEVQSRNEHDNDEVMAALAHIFPKALLIIQEIICLLKGGYPDGALTKWRSLHELSITAMYIRKRGQRAAVAYLVSFHFSALRSALQINEYSARTGIERFTDQEIADMKDRCTQAEILLGRTIPKLRDGEWPRIAGLNDFFAIERDVKMDHWRPWYRWASSAIHASHRPADKMLGLKDAKSSANLVGSSNSGFVDPFQLTAITLSHVFTTYLRHSVNMDRMVHTAVMLDFGKEMATIAISAEQSTRVDHANSP